jgi:DNA-directed RNA polymerase specialized sigma24 family protein
VDRELGVLNRRQSNHVQEIAGAISTDDQPTVGIFAGVFDGERMVDGVMDVLVNDTVLTGRVVDLHPLMYYEKMAGMAHISSHAGRMNQEAAVRQGARPSATGSPRCTIWAASPWPSWLLAAADHPSSAPAPQLHVAGSAAKEWPPLPGLRWRFLAAARKHGRSRLERRRFLGLQVQRSGRSRHYVLMSSEARFRELFNDHYPAVARYVPARVFHAADADDLDDLDDLLAATFEVAWRRFDAVPAGESAVPWLLAAARNLAHNAERKTKREQSLRDSLATEAAPWAEESVDMRAEWERVRVALRQLRDVDRDLILLSRGTVYPQPGGQRARAVTGDRSLPASPRPPATRRPARRPAQHRDTSARRSTEYGRHHADPGGNVMTDNHLHDDPVPQQVLLARGPLREEDLSPTGERATAILERVLEADAPAARTRHRAMSSRALIAVVLPALGVAALVLLIAGVFSGPASSGTQPAAAAVIRRVENAIAPKPGTIVISKYRVSYRTRSGHSSSFTIETMYETPVGPGPQNSLYVTTERVYGLPQEVAGSGGDQEAYLSKTNTIYISSIWGPYITKGKKRGTFIYTPPKPPP